MSQLLLIGYQLLTCPRTSLESGGWPPGREWGRCANSRSAAAWPPLGGSRPANAAAVAEGKALAWAEIANGESSRPQSQWQRTKSAIKRTNLMRG